jgi:hypothetical protein
VSQYRTFSFQYLSIEKRLQWALQAFFQDLFYYGRTRPLQSVLAPVVDRDTAEAVSSQRGGNAFVIYPVNKYTAAGVLRRLHASVRALQRPALAAGVAAVPDGPVRQSVFRNGHMLPFSASLVRETTVFREYGPVAGNTFKVSFYGSPGDGQTWLQRRTLDVDLRHYQRLVANGVLAFRFKGFKSWGRTPDFSTSAATPRCEGTSTCSSSATRRSSPTSNCAIR